MAREFKRSDRVAAEVQRELAIVLQQEFKNPKMGFITVNAVRVTRDLDVAKVYVGIMNADEPKIKENLQILNQSAPWLRHTLSGRLRMRRVPELRFVYDESVERGAHLSKLIESLDLPKPEDEADKS